MDRSALPLRWGWADWSRTEGTKTVWLGFDEGVRQRFRVRFMEIVAAHPNQLPKEKAYTDRGIIEAKVKKPNPGWRGWCFRDGDTYFVSHLTKKDPKSNDHDTQVDMALEARAEHRARKQRSSQ